MSNTSIPPLTVFAFVVDGEVAWVHGWDDRAERAIAAASSDPKVVQISQEDFARMSPNGLTNYDGWTYLDGVFIEPA